ncbi:MAG: 1-acyl-sn-glycerol-3-phosphate acyltransferase [Fusobacteria bacterium]|nr:1-acyl-sn-glycerol-3-phosphate acyltransferase [Fusobacteriota bacterium]
MFYSFAYWLCKIILFFLGGIKYSGKDNIPKTGTFIAAGNHRSNLDPFLIGLGVDRQMSFVAKDSLFDNPLVKFLLRKANAYPIDRKASPKNIINITVEKLKKGYPITIFPEGTRNLNNDSLLEFKSGVALLAIKAGVPIIPVAILNSRKIFGRKQVIYGKAILPPAEDNKENREKLTRKVKADIENLLNSELEVCNKKICNN